jgi:DNA-binding GntR family transcriptional regulator
MAKPLTRPRLVNRRVGASNVTELRPIQRRTVAAAAVEGIRERILDRTYAEGEQLRQDVLAADLGVSRIPVREALRQLEAEGLVTFSPHRGAVVSSLSIADIEELFALRARLETILLRRAVPHLTEEDIERAEEILNEYDAAFRNRDVAAWGDLNWQFHSTLYSAAHRPVTMAVVERLHLHTNRYARMQLALTRGEARAQKEHGAILAAARKRDASRASSLLNAHILGAGRSLVQFLRGERADGGEHSEGRS